MKLKTIILFLCSVIMGVVTAVASEIIPGAPAVGEEFNVVDSSYPKKILYTVKVLNTTPYEVAIVDMMVSTIPEHIYYSLDNQTASDKAILGSNVGAGQVIYNVVALGVDEEITDPIAEFVNVEMRYHKQITIPGFIRYISDSFFINKFCEEFIVTDNDYYKSVDGVIFDKTGQTLLHFPSRARMFQYELPETVKKIGDFSFAKSEVIIKLHDKIEEIPTGAFWEYKRIKFEFPKGLKKIGKYAFCFSNIDAIQLPEGLEEIGDYAFAEGFLYDDPYEDPYYAEYLGHFPLTRIYAHTYSAIRFALFPEVKQLIGTKAFDIARYFKVVEDPAHYHYNWDAGTSFAETKEWVDDRILSGAWYLKDSDPLFTYVFLSDKQKLEKGVFPEKPTGSEPKENTRIYKKKNGSWCDIYIPGNAEAVNYYTQCINENKLPEQASIIPSTDDYFYISKSLDSSDWIGKELQLYCNLFYGENMKPMSIEWSVSDPWWCNIDENGVLHNNGIKDKITVYLTVIDGKGETWQLSKEFERPQSTNSDITEFPAIDNSNSSMNYPSGVYNLQGIKVGETTEGLPAGIYISEGRKIVVR